MTKHNLNIHDELKVALTRCFKDTWTFDVFGKHGKGTNQRREKDRMAWRDRQKASLKDNKKNQPTSIYNKTRIPNF